MNFGSTPSDSTRPSLSFGCRSKATKQTSIANTEFNRIQLAFNSIMTVAAVGLFKALLHLVAMSESNVLPFHLSLLSFNHFNGKQLVLHFRK